MVKFTFDENGYLIENKFLYSFTQPNKKYINLDINMGEDMTYIQPDYDLVNYPGEYDINGKKIICLVGKDNRLNYLIFANGKKFGIIQSPEILESNEVEDMEYRLYTNDSVERKIDQLELEGEKIKLEDKTLLGEKNLEEVKKEETTDQKVAENDDSKQGTQ
ncbi:hypothetical protein K9M48_03665 [Candidatus Gracilibacteria bacterium]|nr:hypothetical protein [Candidatus Gracilibacteria bacterium]